MKTSLRLLASLLMAWLWTGLLGNSASALPQSGRARAAKHSPSHHTSTHRRHTQPASRTISHTQIVAPVASGASLEPVPEEIVNESFGLSGGCATCGVAAPCHCRPTGFLFDWTRADLWFGTSGFTGQGNFLTNGSGTDGQVEGNFGFQEGFNFGSCMPSLLGGQVGAQLGMRFTHTQLDGTAAGEDNRTQTFITTGLFRRVDYGLQGGLVVDYLHDDWVYQTDLLQLRGELSFLFSTCHDFGFRFSDSQQTDHTTAIISGRANPVDVELSALNNYRFFYRYRFGEGARGLAELQAGFTEDSGGVLGLDLKTPLQNQLGLHVAAIYLLPPDDVSSAFTHEGWNLGMALVWTPGRIFGTQRDYYRPLFDVADNGSLLSRLAQ